LVSNIKSHVDGEYVERIIESGSVDEIRTAVEEFIAYAESLEPMYKWSLCHHLTDTLVKWAKPYDVKPRGSKNNAVVIPPEHAPIMLLFSCAPVNGSPIEIIAGLKKYVERCGEFIPPVYDAVTVAEINRVLNAAQNAYRILDVIAPKDPLYILRFSHSHKQYNSLCDIPDNGAKIATIFAFHPKQNETYNRVFIFAHELGHALHLALTKNIDILPEGFDEFNKTVYANGIDTHKQKQEAFADAAALAILNVKGLRLNFPTEHSKYISPYFARYIKGLTEKALLSMLSEHSTIDAAKVSFVPAENI
jgi:hypothetical protein